MMEQPRISIGRSRFAAGQYSPSLVEVFLSCSEDIIIETLNHELAHWCQYGGEAKKRFSQPGSTELLTIIETDDRFLRTDDLLEAMAYWTSSDIPVYYRGTRYD